MRLGGAADPASEHSGYNCQPQLQPSFPKPLSPGTSAKMATDHRHRRHYHHRHRHHHHHRRHHLRILLMSRSFKWLQRMSHLADAGRRAGNTSPTRTARGCSKPPSLMYVRITRGALVRERVDRTLHCTLYLSTGSLTDPERELALRKIRQVLSLRIIPVWRRVALPGVATLPPSTEKRLLLTGVQRALTHTDGRTYETIERLDDGFGDPWAR